MARPAGPFAQIPVDREAGLMRFANLQTNLLRERNRAERKDLSSLWSAWNLAHRNIMRAS